MATYATPIDKSGSLKFSDQFSNFGGTSGSLDRRAELYAVGFLWVNAQVWIHRRHRRESRRRGRVVAPRAA
jgi:hypothetical protein